MGYVTVAGFLSSGKTKLYRYPVPSDGRKPRACLWMTFTGGLPSDSIFIASSHCKCQCLIVFIRSSRQQPMTSFFGELFLPSIMFLPPVQAEIIHINLSHMRHCLKKQLESVCTVSLMSQSMQSPGFLLTLSCIYVAQCFGIWIQGMYPLFNNSCLHKFSIVTIFLSYRENCHKFKTGGKLKAVVGIIMAWEPGMGLQARN